MSAELAWILAIAFLLVYEFVMIFRRRRLLSHAVWDFVDRHPAVGRWLMFAGGALLSHFFWSRGC